ncbi:mediator-associated protein 1-like, partial [Trifolium medium]|nr:mediator-associated protein 1-like [Trifolium medium]
VSAAAGGSDEEKDDVRLTSEDSKKSFRRIFSEEDELAILKAVADFIPKTGKDPLKDIAAFHDFEIASCYGEYPAT